MFSGSIPAIPTPFGREGIDETALRDHLDWLIEEGSSGIVAGGTTGEGASLNEAERRQVLDACIAQADGRVPVIAGCGSPNTASTLAQVQYAREAGAAAALVVCPYYTRPDQRGILAHFTHLAERGGLPIIIYNVPARTGTDILPETVGQLLRAYPEVFVAIKDATGAIARVADQRDACGKDFCQLSGNDETTLAFMAAGGRGCISVTANVAPRLCAEFQQACLAQDFSRAIDLHDRLLPLHRALFAEPSPAPLKHAMTMVRSGYPTRPRLPMIEISGETKEKIGAALDREVKLPAPALTACRSAPSPAG